MENPIQFIDLGTQGQRIRKAVDARVARILDQGAFILGPDVGEFEAKLSAFGGLSHTLSCGSGTDALVLPLMAWEVKAGDAVFVPSFTFAATAEIVAWLGATPIFVDVAPDTFNMDPASLKAAVEEVRRAGELTPRAVIAVDLFGQIADYPAIKAICDEHGLKLISDAAQGFGSTLDGRMAGEWADVVATSFYPAKPLGCYGDGGAVQTNDAELFEIMHSLRVHGASRSDRYDNVRIGMNGRMDTIQAAVLIEKLTIFPDEIEARNRIADRYSQALQDIATAPFVMDGVVSTWAQYTIKLPAGLRDGFVGEMKQRGVPTVVYYGKPLHRQTAYRQFPVAGGALPVSDELSRTVVSLPMHPYIDAATQDRIVAAAHESLHLLAKAA